MTFVGKVLVIVQVVLSLCFMAFAGAVFTVQQNWKDAHAKKVTELQNEQAKLTEATERISLLESDLAATQAATHPDITQQYLNQFDQLVSHVNDDGVKNQLRALATRAQAAESEQLRLKMQHDQQEQELFKTQESLNRIQILNEIAEREAKERSEEAKKLMAANNDLHGRLDTALGKVHTLEDQVFNQNTAARNMADKQKDLLVHVAYLEDVFRKANVNLEEVSQRDEPPPLVRGVIYNTRDASSNGGNELVEISIGSDDGLAKGHELDIYRTKGDGKYLGRMQLVYVTPDRAVGKVIQKAKNGIIQRGDYVTTQL